MKNTTERSNYFLGFFRDELHISCTTNDRKKKLKSGFKSPVKLKFCLLFTAQIMMVGKQDFSVSPDSLLDILKNTGMVHFYCKVVYMFLCFPSFCVKLQTEHRTWTQAGLFNHGINLYTVCREAFKKEEIGQFIPQIQTSNHMNQDSCTYLF